MEKMMDRQIEETAQFYGIPQISLDNTMGMKEFLRKVVSQTNDDFFSVEAIESLVAGFEINCTEEKLKEQYDYLLSMKTMIDLYKSTEWEWREEEIALTEERKARHDIWLPKIRKAFQEQSNVFVAGGLAHFIGPYNILNLLEKEKFSIKRFNNKCMVE